jgi:hypothetical protein
MHHHVAEHYQSGGEAQAPDHSVPAALAAEPGWTANAFAHVRLPTPETAVALERIIAGLQWFFLAMITIVLLARGFRT